MLSNLKKNYFEPWQFLKLLKNYLTLLFKKKLYKIWKLFANEKIFFIFFLLGVIVFDKLNNRKNHCVDPKLMDLRIFSNPLLIPLCFHQEQNCRVVNRGENWSKGLQWISHYFNEWLLPLTAFLSNWYHRQKFFQFSILITRK